MQNVTQEGLNKYQTGALVVLILVDAVLYAAGLIPMLNAILLPVFGGGLYGFLALSHQPFSTLRFAARILLWLVLVVLGFFIASYRPSGFNYPLLWQTQALHEGGLPFSLYANVAKGLAGYVAVVFLLSYTFRNQVSLNNVQWPPLRHMLFATCSILAVFCVAMTFFDVTWQPKLANGLVYFFVVNLCITVIAEEAFFRLLVQNCMASFFKQRTLGIWCGAIVSIFLFAFAHTGALNFAFLLFLFAGAMYCAVYTYTRNFRLAVFVHFGVNILHFIFLEYPLAL